MTLTLTEEETKELRAALVQAHTELLRRMIDTTGPGYSALRIDLSGRRIRLERLLKRLSQRPEPPAVARPAFRKTLTAIA